MIVVYCVKRMAFITINSDAAAAPSMIRIRKQIHRHQKRLNAGYYYLRRVFAGNFTIHLNICWATADYKNNKIGNNSYLWRLRLCLIEFCQPPLFFCLAKYGKASSIHS